MRAFPFKRWQNSMRWIFIFCVLTGLFFSGGEGVQLFPFPVMEGDNSKTTSSFQERNSKSYAFSIYNSANHTSLFKSKFQKHACQYLSGAHLIFNWSNSNANFYFQSVYNRKESDPWHTSVLLGSITDRGPPVI
jgi:hypothetical protein